MPANYVHGVVEPFTKQMRVFVTNAQAAFDSVTQTGQRTWAVPDVHEGWDKDVLNYTGADSIGKAFDRTLLNQKYWLAVSRGARRDDSHGRIGEARCAKYQIDALAAMERAYRERSRSYVRAAYTVIARKQGHKGTQGPLEDIIGVVNRMITQVNVDNIRPQGDPVDTENYIADVDIGLDAAVGTYVT